MTALEESLMQLQHLIEAARRDGGSQRDHNALFDTTPRVEDLTRRFSEIEAQLFHEEHLRSQAMELHRRAQRRRREQHALRNQTELSHPRLSPSQEVPHPNTADTEMCETDTQKSKGLPKTPYHSGWGPEGDEMLIDLTIPWRDPPYSFAQSYAKEDRRRLVFVIDQLSHALRVERRRREVLQHSIVPVMIRRMESLDREVEVRRREWELLQRLVGSDAALQDHSIMGWQRVRELVEQCEEQLRRLGG